MTEATSVVDEMMPVTDRPEFPIPKGKDPGYMVVEIDCRVLAQPIPGNHLVVQGVHRYRLAKHWLPVLEDQVISDEDKVALKRSEELHDKLLKKYVEDNAGRLEGVERQLKEQELRARYGGSPEALFTRDTLGRSIPPFFSVKVIDDTLPAPVDEAAAARAKETAELVAKVMPQSNDVAATVAAVIEQLAAKGLLQIAGGQNQQNQKKQ